MRLSTIWYSIAILLFLFFTAFSVDDIFEASETGDFDKVKTLLEENPQLLNISDNSGYTPLHNAAYNGHLNIAEHLITLGANVSAASGSGSTPLHGAAFYGHPEIAQLLLNNGAEIDAANAGGYTPLLSALAGNQNDIARLLINKGANVNVSPSEGNPPLYQAVMNADIEFARFLLDKGAESNIQTDMGVSLPFFAISSRGREFALMFSDKVTDYKETDELGLSLLHYSAARGLTEQVQILIEQGLEVNAKDSLGKTPFSYASLWGHGDVMDILASHGATSAESEQAWFKGDYLGRPTPDKIAVEFVGDELRTPFAASGGIAFSPDGSEMLWCQQAMPIQAMWYSRQVDGIWQKPIIAPFTDPTLNYADGSPCFSADGNRIYFHSRRPISETDGRKEDSDIWYVERTGGGWGDPISVGSPVNTDKNEYGASIAPSGNLYFMAEGYEDGHGQGDIYISELVNGDYTTPRNLSSNINSEFHEMTPCISPDESYILFLTTNTGIFPWGLPLKVSFKRKDGSWSKAASIGGNTRDRGDIQHPFITADNKFVFYQQEMSFYWFSTASVEDFREAIIGPAHVEAVTRIPVWHQSEQVFEPMRTNDIAFGDLDSDGDLDAVFTNMDNNDSYVYLNDGKGQFTATELLLIQSGHGVDFGDIDADGDLDIVISCAEYGLDLMVYLNDGQANFTVSPQNLEDTLLVANSINLFDVDLDGDLDAAVIHYREDNIIYLNNGQGQFSRSDLTFPNGANWADLDGDGDIDILHRKTGVGFETLLNDGTGHFIKQWSKTDSIVQRGWVGLGDFDGDGDCDAVVPYSIGSEHYYSTMWYNDGTGQFTESGIRLPLTSLSRMSTGDLNGDGHLDIFLNNVGLPSTIWLNDGNGGLFDSGVRIPGEWRWLNTFCPLGDLDGDGDLDVFITAFMGGSNELWFNDTE